MKEKIKATLAERFGYTEFRPGQENIVTSILRGRDALAIMPTGGGKSICYQLPAIMMKGLTFVISPLISLMTDQVMSLKAHGIPAAYVNSTLNYLQIRKVYQFIREGRYKIIYVAPERLETEDFLAAVSGLEVSLVAVDEAHCISQWGNDFRPSYLHINDFVSALAKRPVLAAFTATATKQVREDICTSLRLNTPETVITGFERPNLHFEIREPADKLTEAKRIVAERRGKSGIIYCSTRSAVETVHSVLDREGYPATRYHAGLSEEERQRNQEDFIYDRKPLMVATNAFGMGIDKPDVSFVLHFNMPSSLEAYYQEAGRAGRDGSEADCILLFSPKDIVTAKYLINSSEPAGELSEDEVRAVRLKDLMRLERMIGYCRSTRCLVEILLEYFGERRGGACGACGNCRTVFLEKDVTEDAVAIIFAVIEMKRKRGYTYGRSIVTDLLSGSKRKELSENGLTEFSSYGKLSHLKKNEIKDLLGFLEEGGYIATEGDFGQLTLTDTSADLLVDGARLTRPVRRTEPPKKTRGGKAARSPLSGKTTAGRQKSEADEKALYDALSRLRRTIAEEKKVPPYIIFSNATLLDMARRMPSDTEEFLSVSGVGDVKARQYGNRFLALIEEFRKN